MKIKLLIFLALLASTPAWGMEGDPENLDPSDIFMDHPDFLPKQREKIGETIKPILEQITPTNKQTPEEKLCKAFLKQVMGQGGRTSPTSPEEVQAYQKNILSAALEECGVEYDDERQNPFISIALLMTNQDQEMQRRIFEEVKEELDGENGEGENGGREDEKT